MYAFVIVMISWTFMSLGLEKALIRWNDSELARGVESCNLGRLAIAAQICY